jgi:hypothetical protein
VNIVSQQEGIAGILNGEECITNDIRDGREKPSREFD